MVSSLPHALPVAIGFLRCIVNMSCHIISLLPLHCISLIRVISGIFFIVVD